ncbi:neutral ceramidase precursor [Cordyceps fumosorosea ARSEF 2679]|uniref:Neutral ceramidase n=1 Tax=Cordyceps fumosorosea (strain ARSEF 2679) TaxID=1081104 RepID=A0A167NDE1_CORFA|nr:neutral ceramidase precursor [Cordyceps fumosorosea ARSEF 2679]OAA55426.1 neutral ceramidase precursor [Cordyceps fumosorosea ARSEF 2679]
MELPASKPLLEKGTPAVRLDRPLAKKRRSPSSLCGNCTIVLVLALACVIATLRVFGTSTDLRPWSRLGDWGVYESEDADEPPSGLPAPHETDRYLVGVSKADITGPVVELNMMGYADANQIGSGLRQRLYSRAFIVGDLDNPKDRFIYLVLDTQSGDTAVRFGILNGLQKLGPSYAMYNHDNLAVTATHSHSGPGAWLNYLLPQITSKGFDKQSYQAIVDGCILSIQRAHETLAAGTLSVGKTKIFGANINRSLFSYLANPEEERQRYNISAEDDGSVEKDITVLKFQRAADGKNIGVLTWFPTHGTSMQANNTLITGDNKGLAADLFERRVRGGNDETDDFVAGFSQANMGDASPNVLGAYCEDTGEPCDFKTSSCSDGRPGSCRSRGPLFLKNDYGASSCFEIARLQVEGAMSVYSDLKKTESNVRGVGVKAVHEFHDMAGYEFVLPNGTAARTCPAALGYSFGGGTSDEPGHFDLIQHGSNMTNSSPIWRVLRWLLKPPSQEQIDCQYPKPIVLDVGEVGRPYEWTPNIVDVQTFRVGQLLIIVSPGEATTMAGRRWKEAVEAQSKEQMKDDLAGQEPIVVIGAPSNSYTHYITTEQEYNIQRYEGASTLYGAHTLAAYVNRTLETLHYLKASHPTSRAGRKVRRLPPDNSERAMSFIPGVVFDRTWSGGYGSVSQDVDKSRFRPGETVRARFVGANPRNNLRLEGTYAAVEYRAPGTDEEEEGGWTRVRDDSDWGLAYRWKRLSGIRGTSEVTLEWEVEEWARDGEYRLRYFGDAKTFGGGITAFEGIPKALRR